MSATVGSLVRVGRGVRNEGGQVLCECPRTVRPEIETVRGGTAERTVPALTLRLDPRHGCLGPVRTCSLTECPRNRPNSPQPLDLGHCGPQFAGDRSVAVSYR